MIERLRITLADKYSKTRLREDIFGSYTGTGLHGVPQVAHKGLVFWVIAAGQLNEALEDTKPTYITNPEMLSCF